MVARGSLRTGLGALAKGLHVDYGVVLAAAGERASGNQRNGARHGMAVQT